MKTIIARLILAFSGVLLLVIGGALLTAPQQFLATSGVEIAADPSLLSELKAPGALLIIAGLVLLTGSIQVRFANFALTTGVLVFGGYGLARLLSMLVDGLPSHSLIIATAIELALAVAMALLRTTNAAAAPPVRA